jgi:hypothetical protein
VLRQDLRRELGIKVSLGTVEWAVRQRRREVLAQSLATVRFETAPGEQMQIDFGSLSVEIGGEQRKNPTSRSWLHSRPIRFSA